MIPNFYAYKAVVVSVTDGDTVRVNIDLGYGKWDMGDTGKGVPLRLHGINAPEKRGKEKVAGLAATEFLKQILIPGRKIWYNSIKDKSGKFGRPLAEIHVNTSLDRTQEDYDTWDFIDKSLAEKQITNIKSDNSEKDLNVNTFLVLMDHAVYHTY